MGDFEHQEDGWDLEPYDRRRRQLPVAIAFLVLLVVGAGAAVWWFSRGPSESDIAAQLKDSLQQELRTGQMAQFRLQVVDVQVIHASGNQYKGVADVRTVRGALHQVALDVTTDGDRVLWQTSPGAFFFAAQERLAGAGFG